MQPRIGAHLIVQQLCMLPDLGNVTPFHDNQPIGLAQGTESMRDGNGRAALDQII